MKKNLIHSLFLILSIIAGSNLLQAQNDNPKSWKAGIYFFGSLGFPEIAGSNTLGMNNSMGIGVGGGISITKKYFSLKTEIEHAEFKGTITSNEDSDEESSENSFKSKNLYFKLLTEFYPIKKRQEIFVNIGPVFHFREILEDISISEKRGGVEFNIGYSPEFNKIRLLLSVGSSGSVSISSYDRYYLLYFKANVGIKFNLQ